MGVICAVLLFLSAGLMPAGAAAQGVTTAAISGTITSAARQPIANAQVTARNVATGFTRTVATNAQGGYFIANLLPGGPYTVTAQAAGIGSAQASNIRLVLNQTSTVNLQMREEAVQIEGLTVRAESNAIIAPSRTGAGTVISEESIENIPSLSRNFTDIAAVSPHVYVTGGAPSVGGANNRFNNIQIDGAVNNDVFGLASSGVPGGQADAKPIPLDAIDQFQVLVTPFDVRQAGFTGGLINAVTKSGTNRFSGSVYGYYRNENFTRGDTLRIAGRTYRPPAAFFNRQLGFTLGGPIMRDRLFFFVAGELENRETPDPFSILSDPVDIRVLPERINEVATISRGYGLEPGSADPFAEETRLGNLFGRLDYRFSPNHRLVLRHNFSPNYSDAGISRGGSRFDLTSHNYFYDNSTNSTVLQVFSELGGQLSNELLVNFSTVRDRPTPASRFPRIDVRTRDQIGGRSTSGMVRIGAEYFRHGNELDQTILQLTDNLNWSLNAHRVTVGANAEYYSFRNLFFPGSLGAYQFSSIADFSARKPSYYEINLPLRDDVTARFDVLQPGIYAQDEWTVSDNLNLTAGLRLDVPLLLDRPDANTEFESAFGRSTSQVPTANPLLSPRIGFNYRMGELSTTQLRGGLGVFSGRPPYVWLSNVYGNTGRDFVLLQCRGANAPTFDPTRTVTECADGSGPRQSPALVNIVDEDFRFPQDFKASIGVDHELPLGFVGTLEGIYTHGLNQGLQREINLAGPQNVPASSRQGIGDRTIYGTPQTSTIFAFSPVRADRRFSNVIEMLNTDEGYSYSLTAELARTFADLFNVRGSYTFLQAKDVQSLTSSIATSNVGFHPVGAQIEYPLTDSEFERPHKINLSGSATLFPRFGGTEISALYVGMSGRNYSYVYADDINGDGFPGPGLTSRRNDLVYVPADMNEIVFQSPDDARLLQELIDLDPCLSEARGQILARNSCRGPWFNRLDVRVTQGIPVGPGGLQLEANFFNFLNLLNSGWGVQRGPQFNGVRLLDGEGRRVKNDPTSPIVFSYDGFTYRDESGTTRAQLPYTVFFGSRYQIQLGLRYRF